MSEAKNWQELSRSIVKLIRDQFGIEETRLKRSATLEGDLGLSTEQVEFVMECITEAYGIKFPDSTLNEIMRLEELCLLACWLQGFYKQPSYISAGFAGQCRAINPRAHAE